MFLSHILQKYDSIFRSSGFEKIFGTLTVENERSRFLVLEEFCSFIRIKIIDYKASEFQGQNSS